MAGYHWSLNDLWLCVRDHSRNRNEAENRGVMDPWSADSRMRTETGRAAIMQEQTEMEKMARNPNVSTQLCTCNPQRNLMSRDVFLRLTRSVDLLLLLLSANPLLGSSVCTSTCKRTTVSVQIASSGSILFWH